MIKKGLSKPDNNSINLLKQAIIDGLKQTTREFDFDNIDVNGGEALFSKEQLAPVSSSIVAQISKLLNIHEQSVKEIKNK